MADIASEALRRLKDNKYPVDMTKHDPNVDHVRYRGDGEYITHTAQWYALFGNKCPVCGAPAEVK